jgi:hypothetical protein
MTIVLRGTQYEGPLVNLTDESVDGSRLHEEIAAKHDTPDRKSSPGPLYGRIGHVQPRSRPAVRAALRLAMRTHRIETPVDRALASAQQRRAAVEIPESSLAAARAAVAEAGEQEAALRERVARLGGRVSALRETVGADASADETSLEAATSELAEAETTHIAAKQRLARARKEARSVRDRHECRRRLGDRVANRQQQAQAYLVKRGWPRFREAIAAIPAAGEAGDGPSEWSGPGWVATVALIHLAEMDTPVVVEGDLPLSVTDPEFLGTPIILV